MPSPNLGWTSWDDGFLRPFCYINGLKIALGAQAYTKTPQEGSLFALKTHANTHIVQRLYQGPESSRLRQGFRFSGTFMVFNQELAEKLREVLALGAPFYYCPLDRATETFDIANGQSYKLTRPLATSILSGEGVDETSHPTKYFLDGSLDPTAASISGQTLTAAASGVLVVHYTPIYRVISLDWSEEIPQNNGFDFNYTFEEVVTV